MAEPQIFTKCLYCTCKSGPFRNLEKDELKLVDKNRTEISYDKGEIIFKQGSFVSHIPFIKTGLVKIFLEGKDGDTILNIVNDGYFLGLQSLFGKNVYHYTAEALSDTEVCLISIETFKLLVKRNGEFAASIIETLNDDTVTFYNRLDGLQHKQMNGRFASLLIFLAQKIYNSGSFVSTLSRKEMAEIASVSNESVSRLIKEFKKDGIIDVQGNNFSILDEDRLFKISKIG